MKNWAGFIVLAVCVVSAAAGVSAVARAAPILRVDAPSAGTTTQWTHVMGCTCFVRDIASKPNGFTYVVGTTLTEVAGLKPKGYSDAFVAAFNPRGALRWVRLLDDEEAGASGVAIGGDGSVYVAATSSRLFIPDYPDGGFYYVPVVAKYSKTGVQIWVREFHSLDGGAAGGALVSGIAASKDGSLLIAGALRNRYQAGVTSVVPGDSPAGLNIYDVYSFVAARVTQAGSMTWRTEIPGATGFEVDSSATAITGFEGAAYVAGHDGGNLMVARLASDGAVDWQVIEKDVGRSATALTVAGSALFVTGSEHVAGSTARLFLARYDLDGNQTWITEGSVSAYQSGDSIVGGTGDTAVWVGATRLKRPKTGTDAALLGFDADGKRVSQRIVGGRQDETGASVSVSAAGAALLGVTTASRRIAGEANPGPVPDVAVVRLR